MRRTSKLHDFSSREGKRNCQILGNDGDLASQLRTRHGVKFASVQEDRTSGWGSCAAQEFQKRSLAGSVGTEDGDAVTCTDVERDVREDRLAVVIKTRLRDFKAGHA